MSRHELRVVLICLAVFAVAMSLAACGLFNAALAAHGVPGAATPEAQQAAQQADFGIWQWLGQLFGVQPITPQGPTQTEHDVAILSIGVGAKHIARGVHRVARYGVHAARAVSAGAVHAVRTVRTPPAPKA